MSEVEKSNEKSTRSQLNLMFHLAWRKILEKYTCELDAIDKM